VHDTVSINYTIAYSGDKDNDKKPILQKLPVAHFRAGSDRIIAYYGDMPWYNEQTTDYSIETNRKELLCPERWVAVMYGNFGIGVFFPHTSTVEIQRTSTGAIYVAPTRLMLVEPSMKTTFSIFLCVGDIGHIRSVFSILRNSLLDSSVTYREVLNVSEHLSSDAKGNEFANSIRNGPLRLSMQKDGNVVLYNEKEAVWSAQTWDMGEGKGPYRLEMQRDGNLVAYAGDGKPYWHTNTTGAYGAYLAITVRRGSKTPVAEVRVGRTVKWTTERLMGANDVLEENTFIEHKNLKLIMQTDGNVVLYKDKIEDGKKEWSSETSYMKGKGPFKLKMQADGDLVALDGNDEPYWNTKTEGNDGAHVFFYEAEDPNTKKKMGQVEVRVNDTVLWEAVVVPLPTPEEPKFQMEAESNTKDKK
jgi:hypothetical protein